jgi:hypothetical protein
MSGWRRRRIGVNLAGAGPTIVAGIFSLTSPWQEFHFLGVTNPDPSRNVSRANETARSSGCPAEGP